MHKGQTVYSKPDKKHYVVKEQYSTPRSYILKGQDGEVKRRNRRDLVNVKFQPVVPQRVPQAQESVPQTSVRVKTDFLPRRSTRPNMGVLPARYRD